MLGWIVHQGGQMARSTQVLAVHCFLFQAFVISGVLSPFLAAWFPAFYDQTFFPIYLALVLAMLIGWSPYLGGCTLITLEKRFRQQEGKPAYNETFIAHYIREWTGKQVPGFVTTTALFALMILPVLIYAIGFLQ
jgi:hypothetical protein